jgi:hypothetical protein
MSKIFLHIIWEFLSRNNPRMKIYKLQKGYLGETDEIGCR